MECCYCGRDNRETRPYGPGGAATCFPCLKSTPERESTAKAAFGALLDANAAISATGVVVIGEESGPRPFDPNEAR